MPRQAQRPGGGVLGLPRDTALPVAALMIVGAALYLLWWGAAPTVQNDTPSYQVVAQDLSDGSLERLHDRTPGYPALLLVTDSEESLRSVLTIVQLALHLLACWLTLALAQRFGLQRGATILLATLLLSPPLTEKAFYALSEATTEVLVVAALLLFVQWRETASISRAIAAGFFIGAAALVRPTYQALGLLVAVAAVAWLCKKGRRAEAARSGAALVAGSLVLVGGILILNSARFDFPGLTPLFGWNLSTKTALYVEDLPSDEPARDVLISARNQSLVEGESHTGVLYVWPVRDTVAEAVGLERPAIDGYMVGLNLRLIASNPIDYASAVGNATSSYLLPSSTNRATGGSSVLQLVFGMGHYFVLIGFALQAVGVAGLYIARQLGAIVSGPFADPKARRVWLASLVVVAYTAAVSVSVEIGNPRYRTPTDPLILLLAAGGLWTCWCALRPPATQAEE